MRYALMTALLGTLAALAASPSVRAEMIPIEWGADGRFSKQATIPPGKFVEACEKLPKGAKVDWRFEAAAPLNFNIHYHVGKDVQFPEKRDGIERAEGTLAVGLKQDYCWMWTNKGSADATLQFTLSRPPARLPASR
jgi:hypothetical protein